MSQREFSEEVGIDHSTMSRLELGNRLPTGEVFAAIVFGANFKQDQVMDLLKGLDLQAEQMFGEGE